MKKILCLALAFIMVLSVMCTFAQEKVLKTSEITLKSGDGFTAGPSRINDLKRGDWFGFKDVDLTSILSNSLENALKAVVELPANQRIIDVNIRMKGPKLLISVKNTFSKTPQFVDGLPQAEQSNHGLGTQSIQFVAEKLKGNCQFSVQDDMFVLQVIL